VFPFAASGRARAMEAPAGFVKLVAAVASDEILGVHIIGPMAGELIAEAVLAMEFRGSTEDLQRTMHAHPTLAEALHEAALAADKRSIDNINRSQLDELVVTDTIPLSDAARGCNKIRQLSVAELLAETIRRIAFGESVSSLYVD